MIGGECPSMVRAVYVSTAGAALRRFWGFAELRKLCCRYQL
jgi:hypothetical protein